MLAQTNVNYSVRFVLTRKSDGLPYDLTGKMVQIDFKRRRGAAAQLTASTTNGILSSGSAPVDGILTFTLTYAQIKVLTPDNYSFDAVYVSDASNQYFLFSGIWPLGPGITNDPTLSRPAQPDIATDSTASIIIDDVAETLNVSVIDTSSTADVDAVNPAKVQIERTGTAGQIEFLVANPGLGNRLERISLATLNPRDGARILIEPLGSQYQFPTDPAVPIRVDPQNYWPFVHWNLSNGNRQLDISNIFFQKPYIFFNNASSTLDLDPGPQGFIVGAGIGGLGAPGKMLSLGPSESVILCRPTTGVFNVLASQAAPPNQDFGSGSLMSWCQQPDGRYTLEGYSGTGGLSDLVVTLPAPFRHSVLAFANTNSGGGRIMVGAQMQAAASLSGTFGASVVYNVVTGDVGSDTPSQFTIRNNSNGSMYFNFTIRNLVKL